LKYSLVVCHHVEKQLNASDVYEILVRIPEGKVTTYGDIARFIGHPGAARAVGKILNKNPNPIVMPCHRVVMSSGSIGGYSLGKSRKRELLAKEGLRFTGDGIPDFAKCRVELDKLL
jgi:methylated-DNA-[protein]-cysteine S-methyltransferase